MSTIENHRAKFHYFLEDYYKAGLVLEGWEVKAIRAGNAQLEDSYVIVRAGEIWLLGAHINPLNTISTHICPEVKRTRKLLLKSQEIKKLIGKVERRGYSMIPTKLYHTSGRIKLDFALGLGKKLYDKRHTLRERAWTLEKERFIKSTSRIMSPKKDRFC